MPCDPDDAAVQRLIGYLEKTVLDLLHEQHRAEEYRARELLQQWLAERPASSHNKGGQQ